MSTKILLVDDHRMVRSGLRALLQGQSDFSVVAEASDGREAVHALKEYSPDVVVMDLKMPDLNGIDATRQMLALKPELRVVGLSGNSEEKMTVEMFRAGALGYVLKDAAFEELVAAIRTVLKGKAYLSPSMTGLIVEDYIKAGAQSRESVFGVLSSREREVLQLIAEGKATKEIAGCLQVSVKTAETHRRNLMEKLHVESVAELTKYAIREGLTDL